MTGINRLCDQLVTGINRLCDQLVTGINRLCDQLVTGINRLCALLTIISTKRATLEMMDKTFLTSCFNSGVSLRYLRERERGREG